MILNKPFVTSLIACAISMASLQNAYAGDVVLTVEKNQVISCEEYYNKSTSTPYVGEVVKKGHYVVEKDPVTYVLTKSFVVDAIVVNCKSNPKVEKEFRMADCDEGFVGDQKQYRNYIKDENLEAGEASISYPNGENWVTMEQNCSPADGEVASEAELPPNVLMGMFTGEGVKTSELKTGKNYENFILSLNKSTLSHFRLNLIIDNFSKGEYNIQNVTSAVKEFTAKTNNPENFSIVSIPQTLIGYIGYDGLKREQLRGKVFQNAYITDEGQVIVSYQIMSPNSEPENRVFTVDLFTEQLGVGQTNAHENKKSNGKYIYR
jgi:hypothetical protein